MQAGSTQQQQQQRQTTTTTTTKTKKLSSSNTGNMVSSVSMTSATKTTTTTTTNNNNNNGTRKLSDGGIKSTAKGTVTTTSATTGGSSDAKIAELSKKINEHADTFYHTWKSSGLAPEQLHEMYTNAAATAVGDFTDVAAAAAAAANTTEELQKFVNSFVIKDKEQRGKKSSSSSSSDVVTTAATTTAPQANGKVKKSSTSSTPTTTTKSSLTPGGTSTTRAKSPTATKSSTRSSQNPDDAALQSPKKVAAAATKITSPAAAAASSASPASPAAAAAPTVDINLNYDINLQMNVNNLSQQQAQNLLKISELLHQQQQQKPQTSKVDTANSTTATATTTTVTKKRTSGISKTNSKLTASSSSDQQQSKKAAATHSKANAIDAIPSVDVVDVAQRTRVGGTAVTAVVGPTDKNSEQFGAIRNTTTKTTTGAAAAAATTTTSTTPSKLVKTKESEQKPAIKEKPATVRKSIATNRTDNNTSNSNNSNSNNNNNNINTTTTSNIVANTSSSAAAVATAAAAAAATTTATAVATSASTTMPTLNKVKPSSGSRAPLTNGQGPDKNLGRPILTRGSVAERVMMFEKCPDVRNSFLNIKRPDADAPPKSLMKVKLHATPPVPPQEQNSLQREIRTTKSVYIPRFYFPHGKPQPTIAMERVLRGILSAFDSFPNNQVTKDELPRILKLCGLPFYWRMPVMVFCQTTSTGLVERQRFVEFWKQMNVYCHEAASRFVYILSRGQRFRSYIVPEDLVPMVQDVVDTHPGLAFLKEATEFHSRYVHTVIARIFYSVNRSWSGRITISELKRSDLLEMISLLEDEEDINQIMAFFSYEHFYVIYCKFWELDKDHDLLINQEDLAKHSDHALSSRIVDRIFSGCVTRSDNKKSPEDEPKMSYTDFVWFILSEEDKRTPTAIEYWFRCMDIDGDGVLSMYELEYFYEEQQQRMEGIGIECLPFEDCLCQMLDMIKPANRDCIALGDLKRCKMTHVFFDTFFNLEKYLDHEQRDPFASQRDEYTSDWDRFAAQEYELLIAEEN